MALPFLLAPSFVPCSQRPTLCLQVSDLDGTMVGDDSATGQFKSWWEDCGALRGGVLVYNTGRWVYCKAAELLAGRGGVLGACGAAGWCTTPAGGLTAGPQSGSVATDGVQGCACGVLVFNTGRWVDRRAAEQLIGRGVVLGFVQGSGLVYNT